MADGTLKIRTSRRFTNAQEGLGPGLRGRVIGAVHDFVRRFEADRRAAAHGYDRIAHMSSTLGELLEIDVTGKDRLLALWAPPDLTLLDVGGHNIVPRYRPSMLDTDVRTAVPAPPGLYPVNTLVGDLFENSDSRNWQSFAGEDAPDWMYSLAPTQTAIVHGIRRRLSRSTLSDPTRYFIVGGPGTGKTSILLSLMISLTEEGKSVGLVISDSLAEFLDRCGIDVSAFRRTGIHQLIRPVVDVLLVDDPGHEVQIQQALHDAYGQSRCVVVAFDPCQLDSDLTDRQYTSIVTSNGVTAYPLRDCYRQKDVAGRAAKRVIDRVAESSPFLAQAKKEWFAGEHREVFSLSNELRFVNRGGVTQVWENGDLGALRDVASKIQTRKQWGMKAPPILIVVDEFTAAKDWSWKGRFGSREFTLIGLKELSKIKGLEFQWVVIAIRESLYLELQTGFTGSSQRIYQYRRLLRIPFSRARDGILTLVLPDVARPDIADSYQWS